MKKTPLVQQILSTRSRAVVASNNNSFDVTTQRSDAQDAKKSLADVRSADGGGFKITDAV